MKTLLFNIHDVILVLTIGCCALLSTVYFVQSKLLKEFRYLVATFFAVNALIALNTLFFWGEPIRQQVFDHFSYLYLILGCTSFIIGPLMYWQAHILLNRQFKISTLQLLHFLPATLAFLYLYIVCFRFPHDQQRDLFLNFELYQQPHIFYFYFKSLEKLIPVVYGVSCILLIFRNGYANHRSEVRSVDIYGMIWLAGGFSVIWLWSAITHVIGSVYPGELADYMGILGNYLKLALLVFLVYYQLLRFIHLNKSNSVKDASLNLQHIDRITNAMASEKIYMNQQLTLERFAEHVGLLPREVSTTINRDFHQNFQEFVNSYRIEDAKKMLSEASHSDWSILDIATASGFSSKATFNRFFKKVVLMTPSDYRQKVQSYSNTKSLE